MTQYRNKFATHKTIDEKKRAYRAACVDSKRQALAHRSDGTTVPLADVNVNDVEFIGGLWRLQNPFTYKIQDVRGIEFVLLNKLPHTEKTLFEFYRAAVVGENCYGRYLTDTSYIVAKYTTDDGEFWGYGSTIEQARAFLGVKLYDEYKDLIHQHACRGQKKIREK